MSKQSKDAELLEVTQKLANLNTNDLREYFNGFNEIYDELNNKKLILEEDLIVFEESIPELKQKLKNAQNQVQSVRLETIKAFADAENERKKGINKLEDEAPELLKALTDLSETKQNLDILLFSKSFLLKTEEAKMLLDSRAYENFRSKYDEISKLCGNADTISFVIEESFNEKIKEQTLMFINHLRKTLFERFTVIRFPFETAIDHNAVRRELEIIAEILKTLHVLYQNLKEVERVSILDIIFYEFEKRFNFHFYGEKPTNLPSKPEWFYAEISAWISANISFMEGHLQPLFTELGQLDISVSEEFIESLVTLAAGKVRDLISSEEFVIDKRLLSHLIDETVIFEKELQEIYMYSESSRHAISELCRQDILDSWIEMERDTISAGIDNILSDQNAYDCRFQDATDLDEYLVPNFADAFVILMQAMTERYRSIPDERIQCQFLKLQLMIVDEFRIRIVQISQVGETPLTHPNPQLLNALWYMTEILDEWSASPDFIRLQSYATSGNVAMKGTFDDLSSLYRHVWRQMTRRLSEYFADEISHKLKAYSSVKWFLIENHRPADVTPQFVLFLNEIEKFITWLNNEISPVSVMTFYHLTNHEIWNSLEKVVISHTNFNYHGASQMFFDVTTGLIPLLESLYKWQKATVDGTLNKKCIEILNTLKLLSLPSPTAILLREEIERIPEQMCETVLKPFSLSGISKQRILELFKQRCDMNSII
uniref:RAD50-interacting protein 1 n=1 Tax=Panagrolaimus sp. PS1159 TaxID=55785 RepID=A0AC35GT27_9BILA